VFHKIKFWNEVAHGNTTLDSIHAYPARIKEGKMTHPPRFDTALVFLQHGSAHDARPEVAEPSISGSSLNNHYYDY
jgi:hypothetical protein